MLVRHTARLLPVDPDGRVLLLHERDPFRPGDPWWGSIGGAIDAGESAIEAAVREMREETGVVITTEALLGPVFHIRHEFSYAGVERVGDHTFFALSLDRDTPVSFEHLEPDEIGNVLASGWWTPDALEADGRAVSPQLPDALRAAVRAVEEAR